MWRKVATIVIVLAVLVALAVVAINWVLVEDDLASCQKPGQNELCTKADAIVAVSGGDTAARAKRAIALYQAGWAPKLIFSGASADPKSISNAQAMQQIARAAGVPAKDIYLDEDSRDTHENAQNVAKILEKLDARNVILVSSPYHLRRVKLNFVAVGGDIAYRTAAADDANWHHWFLSLNGWKIALTELGGLAQLGMKGNK